MKKKAAIMRVIDRFKDNVARNNRFLGWREVVIIALVTAVISMSLAEFLRCPGYS